MTKKEVLSIISKIAEIKKHVGFKIIDTHVHPLDVMGVAHYSDTKKGSKKSNFFEPDILEKLTGLFNTDILKSVQRKKFPLLTK